MQLRKPDSILLLLLELGESRAAFLGGSGLVNTLEIGRDWIAQLPADVVQAVAHPVHDAKRLKTN